jgi:hypothetical protein
MTWVTTPQMVRLARRSPHGQVGLVFGQKPDAAVAAVQALDGVLAVENGYHHVAVAGGRARSTAIRSPS